LPPTLGNSQISPPAKTMGPKVNQLRSNKEAKSNFKGSPKPIPRSLLKKMVNEEE